MRYTKVGQDYVADYDKIVSVIYSCKHEYQLTIAAKMAQNLVNKAREESGTRNICDNLYASFVHELNFVRERIKVNE